MVDTYGPTHGTYTSVQAIAGPLETELLLNIQSLATLLGATITAGALVTGCSA